MKQKSILFKTLTVYFLALLLVGCSWSDMTDDHAESTMDSRSEEMNMMDTMDGAADQATKDNIEYDEQIEELDLGEKIIETASLDYETTNFDQAIDFIDKKIQEYDGQLEHSSRGEGNSSYGFVGEYINMTVRVPKEKLHPFIDQLNEDNNLYIQQQDIGSTDATKTYRDNETRIEVLKDEEETLREMLKEQGSLEEILQIRTRLSEIITEREIFESHNKNIDEEVDFSTVYIYLQQTDRANTHNIQGFWNRLTAAFVDSFYRFIAVSQRAVIGFIYLIPYLLIIGVIGLIAYFIIKRIRKK